MTGTRCPLVVTDELPAPSLQGSSEDLRLKGKLLFILQRCAHSLELLVLRFVRCLSGSSLLFLKM